MNLLQPWNIVFLVGLFVYFWIRHVFIERTKGEKKAVRRFDALLQEIAFSTPAFIPSERPGLEGVQRPAQRSLQSPRPANHPKNPATTHEQRIV